MDLITKNKVSNAVVKEAEKLYKSINLYKAQQPRKISATCVTFDMYGSSKASKLTKTKKQAVLQEEYRVTVTMKKVRNQETTYNDNYVGKIQLKNNSSPHCPLTTIVKKKLVQKQDLWGMFLHTSGVILPNSMKSEKSPIWRNS